MASPEPSTFEKILASFQTRLSQADVELFRITTFDDLKAAVATIQKEQAARKGLRNLNKIKPFLTCLSQYAQVLEVFVQVKPEILGFIWGPIKLCLQIASKLKDAFDVLLDAYERIGTSLPILSAIDALFCNNRHVKRVLEDVFEDILDFHKRAIVFFKQPTWKLCLKTTYQPFTLVFEDVLKNLDRSKELLLNSADIAHFQESQEARILFTKEFQVLVDGQRKQRRLEVMESLSTGPDFAILHQELQEIRVGLPGTTRWIFAEPKMMSWLHGSECALWVCGIPGAGKTVIFSSIIDEIKSKFPDSQVVYFYCKNHSPFRSSFIDVARSLISQILHLSPDCLDFIHESILKSGELRPKNPAFFLRILEEILMNHDSLYIGIDGLDECPEMERKLLSDLIALVSRAQNAPGNIKMLVTSRREKDLEKSLRGIARLDIKPWNVESDIAAYITMRVSQLSQKFDFSKPREQSIAAEICTRPKGMFLLARLIMDNLLDQDSLDDLNEELKSEILPRGIDEAYGRMLVRIGKADSKRGPLEKRVRRANLVLQLLTTASRALYVHEIQGALAINPEEQNVDFEGRHSRLPLDDLCGPIIQVHQNDLVEMIHPTAKEYLWQYHSQHYIKSSLAKETMTTICTSYLTFKCFHPEMTDDQQLECVFRGDFAFQEYAVFNWFHHLNSVLQDRGIDGFSLSSLRREFMVLNDWHKDQPVSLSQSDLPSELDLFQMVDEFGELYDKTDALLTDELGSQERTPYLWRKLYQHRSVIEDQIICATNLERRESLTRYYGKSPFRCPVTQCPYFVAGFTTHEEREKHRKSHQRLFKCTHETCDYFVIGLPSEAALKMHLSLCHEIPSEQPVFASIKTQSLEKGLKDAIEANDLMAVTALATELASFPERSNGYVLQAITLKHREVVFVLLDLLGTPSEINHIHKNRTAILTACEIGDEVLLNKLLERGGNINIHSHLHLLSYRHDFHPLSLAAQNGHITVVRILLNHKDLDLAASYGAYNRKGALTLASMGGFLEIVALLLESDLKSFLAKPLQINRSLKAAIRSGQASTARLILKWAFENGMKSKLKLPSSIHKIPEDDMDKIIQVLSEANREIDEKGGTRENSLQAKAHKGDLTAVSRLLDLGADIENNSGEWGTPLMAAASAGKLEVMQLLIDRGANIMTMDVGKDRSGGSAIDYAAAKGQEKMVKALIDKGARFNFQSLHKAYSYANKRSFNVLQIASQHKNSAPILRLLFEYGALADEVGRNESQSQMSSSQLAAQYGDRDSLQVLLDYGADVNFTNPDGNTPVHSAVEGGQSENLKLLIKQGANINATNKTKKSALMLTMDYSWRDQSSSLIQILVDNGADIDMTDRDGNTALMLAASKGYSLTTLDGFKILVQHGANIRTRNSKRLTVLMIAAVRIDSGFFEYLLQSKSDLYINEVEEIGDALNLAASSGGLETVKLLLKFFGKMDPRDGRFNAALSVALSSATSKGRLDIIPLLLEYGAEETKLAA